MKLNKIDSNNKYKVFSVREIMDDGQFHRRMLSPDMDVSSEVQEIQDKAEAEWTDEVKSAWSTLQAEQEAARKAE